MIVFKFNGKKFYYVNQKKSAYCNLNLRLFGDIIDRSKNNR